MKLKTETMMPKPVALIHVDRSSLSVTHLKLLNYFIWKHHRGLDTAPELVNAADERSIPARQMIIDFESEDRRLIPHNVTTLKEIKAAIGYGSRNMIKLREDIQALAEKALRYNVFEVNKTSDDADQLKRIEMGAMTYLDHVRIESGRNGRVMFTLGAAFQRMLEDMKSRETRIRYVWLDLAVISGLRSKYAVAFYELMNTFTNGHVKNRWELNASFRDYFGIPQKTFQDTRTLKRDVFGAIARKYEAVTGDKVHFDVVKEGKKRFVKITVDRTPDEEKELFVFIAKEFKAENPFAYAHTLLRKYRAGESLTFDVGEYREKFKEHLKRVRQEEIREKFMQRIRSENKEHYGTQAVYIRTSNHGVLTLDDALRMDPKLMDELVELHRKHGKKIFGKILVPKPAEPSPGKEVAMENQCRRRES